MVAIAVEQSNLHRRLALKALLTIGTSPRRLMLGFMLPTMFLSMWISNTATTVNSFDNFKTYCILFF